ncbi:hypothetical protein ES705_09467 [subsurface metagenome]
MAGINTIKLKSLEKTKDFYLYELKKKDLTEKRRNEFLKAKKIIEGIIRKKEESLEIEIERDKHFSKLGGY